MLTPKRFKHKGKFNIFLRFTTPKIRPKAAAQFHITLLGHEKLQIFAFEAFLTILYLATTNL